MIETLTSGGPVMVPIAICSIIGLATFLERYWSTRRSAVVPSAFCRDLLALAQEQRFDDAIRKCKTNGGPMGRIGAVVLSHRGQSRSAIKEKVEEVGRREIAELERFIPVLGIVASITPLLGLLGTVGGMIVTFQVIAEQGVGQVDDLAGGISQALVTTFAGLTVGIPALIANRYLLSRVDRLQLDMEEVALALVDVVCDVEAVS